MKKIRERKYVLDSLTVAKLHFVYRLRYSEKSIPICLRNTDYDFVRQMYLAFLEQSLPYIHSTFASSNQKTWHIHI